MHCVIDDHLINGFNVAITNGCILHTVAFSQKENNRTPLAGHLRRLFGNNSISKWFAAGVSGYLLTGAAVSLQQTPAKQLNFWTRGVEQKLPALQATRKISSETDCSNLNLRLYQYQNCPFCCKVRSYLDYYGYSYELVEVNPITRKEIKFSEYKKVPILVCGKDDPVQINDSSVIISFLQSYMLNPDADLHTILSAYPSSLIKGDDKKMQLVSPNKYFLMIPDKQKHVNEEILDEERKWRSWVDDCFVHVISPNIYRTMKESLKAFQWFSDVSDWRNTFHTWERLTAVYLGATVMFFVGKQLRKRHKLKSDVRESLYDCCNEWLKAIGPDRKFMGGDRPNLADLAMYGAMVSFEGCHAFKEMMENTKIKDWYYRLKSQVDNHAGSAELYLLWKDSLPVTVDEYYSLDDQSTDDEAIYTFEVKVPDSVLNDLQVRLNNTKFFQALENSSFFYGSNANFLHSFHDYWMNSYNWRETEAITQIEGLNVHYIHAKPAEDSKYDTVYPLLLVHGWPGSISEFLKIIPILIDPMKHSIGYGKKYAFEVIAPSIPGFAWSDAPKRKGFGPAAAARVFLKLLDRLNKRRFYCQGGDWGSIIASIIAQVYPERVIGLHLNTAFVPGIAHPMILLKQLLGIYFPEFVIDPADQYRVYPLMEKLFYSIEESGYFHLQSTKPDTVGFALQDSPMGLASYILEKFSAWTDTSYQHLDDGGLRKYFTLDELLTNIMIYWTSDCIVSSMRFYKEFYQQLGRTRYFNSPVLVSTGVAAFPNDLLTSPQAFVTYKYVHLVQYSRMPRGGHFAALEEPLLLADDIYKFSALIN
ncbi:Epoxide hydrolase 1 [Trichinella pseudospiralis]|uniref:Prostaglandin E synthase 2 n=1 Tax=Trichinella pseudospiralis TaxID=6337 RepID=A0A0V1FSU6_TRIPS|nr:Epoxide hydrolase 1 [Trichinella pseudospiralis]